jgi:glycosyltransferase involved in cell wall biosynthesis
MTLNNRKKRILICNDSSFLATGYGVYGKEILSRLHKSGNYEVAELGCYASVGDSRINRVPWRFYPNSVTRDDPRYNEYIKNNSNQFGLWRFGKCVLDFKPDIVFDVRDYWMYSYQEISPLRKFFNWVIMPTVDSAPQKIEWLYTFANADIVVPYTEWAKKILLDGCGDKVNLFPKIANAGVNIHEFLPLHDLKIKKIKHAYFNNPNAIVVGSVMRNQKRKLISDCLLAFKKYLNKLLENNKLDVYNNSILYLHTTYPEEMGWDLPSLLLEHGVADKTYFSYVCQKCKENFPNKFSGPLGYCPKCDNISSAFASPSNPLDNSQLCYLYNTFDLYLQYAICEGFGMPQIEAASCGVPIASVDYSAMTEVVKNLDGFAIPVDRIFRENDTNADRAYPDINKTADIFYNYIVNYSIEEKNNKKIKTRELCCKQYTWDQVYNVWDECFQNVDTSNKLPWDHPIMETGHANEYVTKGLKKYDFVKYICDHIIKDKDIINTGYVQSLLRDFNHIIVSKGVSTITKEHKEIVDVLEIYLKNKMFYEKIRCNSQQIEEDYLLCHR